ncbi:MAG: hypothetical protein WCK89_02545 [bacterium]
MSLTLFGEHPLATDAEGKLKTRIGSLFVDAHMLVTLPCMTHAMQRLFYTAHLDQERKNQGLPPLSAEEQASVWETAVDLIMDGCDILIRPNPDQMALAFQGDEQLLEAASKRHIRFLNARNPKVQQAIRERGEYWRISSEPQETPAILATIESSKIAIGGLPIYYYNSTTGSRFLTVQALETLGTLPLHALRQHLQEIRDYSAQRNRSGHREVAFFASDGNFGNKDFAGRAFEHASLEELRAWHAELVERFKQAVPHTFHKDLPHAQLWRNRMFACLKDEHNDTVTNSMVSGLTPEFFHKVRWLPGGRIENGELLFDSAFGDGTGPAHDAELADLCDQRVWGFICNYLREFGTLQHVNIGGLLPGMSLLPPVGGHRAYLAEVKHRGAEKPVLRILRIQRWGIREHLDMGKDLLWAIMEAQDYTDYTLDRRLGCWELGLPLPGRIDTRYVAETYLGAHTKYHGTRIWTTYYERDFINGLATDKIPESRLKDDTFALSLARLLGQAAAPNLVVGRVTMAGQVTFDGGDEMLLMDEIGRPQRIVVADHAGTFNDYEKPLETFADAYARPATSRARLVTNPAAFIDTYVNAFAERLRGMQAEYRQKRRVFDTLFKYSKQGEKTFSNRWAKVLARLDNTDATELALRIRESIAAEMQKPPSHTKVTARG